MSDTKVEVKKQETKTAARTPMRSVAPDQLQSFQDDMEYMFDRFSRRFGLPSLRQMFNIEPGWRGASGVTVPAVDVTEDEKAFVITAELPGMSEKDIDITLANDMLTIKGEKREETETKDKNYYVSERRFGSFLRSFALSDSVDRDKIEAVFEKGMLTLTLPKAPQAAQQQKKIEVKAK